MTQRVLFIDIETRPALAWLWNLRPEHVPIDMVEEPAAMLCFAAKFKGDRKTQFFSEWAEGREGMVQAAHALLEEADTVVGYNSKRFDHEWVDAEIVMAGLTPPAPYTVVDLYRQTLRLRAISHKLQHVSTHLLRLEGKVQTGGFGLWRKVIDDLPELVIRRRFDDAAIAKARKLMRTYNVQDVDLLEDMWEPLLPWLKVPNANLFTGLDGCPRCGKTGTGIRRGFKHNSTGAYPRFQCSPAQGGCGGWWMDKHRALTTNNVAVQP